MSKTIKNQLGVAHLLLIVVVVAVLGVIGFAGYTVSKKDKSGTKNSATAGSGSSSNVVADKQVEDSCNSEFHDKDLCKFASKFNLDKVSYSAVMNSTGAEGNATINMEVDSKGNSKMVTTQDGQEIMSTVYLDRVSYIKNAGESVWTKYGGGADQNDEKPTDEIKFTASDLKGENNTLSYKSLGKEACGSLTCFKYQVVDSSQPSAQQYLWFDTKDYMMQRWSIKDSNGTMDMKLTYKAVNITAPSPVKDFNS